MERAKEYIAAGDIIQCVPSQRLTVPTSAAPFTIYRALRAINPSPYMVYFNLDGFQIVASSPESLVRNEGGTITTHPLAGTRPRGKTEEDDRALAEELSGDEKERAEHIMLVDLGRNDIGRIAVAGHGARPLADAGRAVQPRHAPLLRGGGAAEAGVHEPRCAARLLPDGHGLRRAEDPRDGDHRASWSTSGAGRTRARSATSATTATWTSPSPCARCPSRTASPTRRRAAASSPTAARRRNTTNATTRWARLLRAIEMAEAMEDEERVSRSSSSSRFEEHESTSNSELIELRTEATEGSDR